MSPMDTAIYWIEYVAKYKGAPFMRPSVTDMPFYQYLLLDVIGFLLLIVIVCFYVFIIIFRLIKLFLNRIFKKTESKKLKKH